MTDSEIIEDWVNLQFLMTCTSALPAHSMSDMVLIDVGEFHFASTPFAHHPIRANQSPDDSYQNLDFSFGYVFPSFMNVKGFFCFS